MNPRSKKNCFLAYPSRSLGRDRAWVRFKATWYNGKLLQGETGALALVRGDFTQAMDVLGPVADTYWGDVAYLAERVLTTQELKTFVDAKVAPSDPHTDANYSIAPAYQ